MTERRRIIEGTWTCSSCDNDGIPGRDKTCPACGNPREDQEARFDFGARDAEGASESATTRDAEGVELAAAGADWFCGACGTANRGDIAQCRSCGGDERLAAPPPPPEREPEPVAPMRSGRRWLTLGCGAVLVALGCSGALCCGLTMWTHDVPGTVSATAWDRTVHLEAFTDVTAEGWRDDLRERPVQLPVNGSGEQAGVANVRDCTRRQRSTRKVAAGTETRCDTVNRRVQCGTTTSCTVKDLGNGFAEEVCNDVPKYCDDPQEECREVTRYVDEPVMDDWCSYDTQEWKRVDTKTAKGTASPEWPDVRADARQRLVKEAHYEVRFAYDGEELVIEPDEATFATWNVGDPAVLVVNGLGVATDAKHPEAP